MIVVSIKKHGIKILDDNGDEVHSHEAPMRTDMTMTIPEGFDYETIVIRKFKIIEDQSLVSIKIAKETEKEIDITKKLSDLSKLLSDIDKTSLPENVKELLKKISKTF